MAGTLAKAAVRAVTCGGVPTMGWRLGLMTSTCAILAWIWDFEPRSSSPLSRSGGFGRRSSSVSAKQAPSRALTFRQSDRSASQGTLLALCQATR